jgi:murein DD-endopeptidase MepM/ murein hydrolase activator NlpD
MSGKFGVRPGPQSPSTRRTTGSHLTPIHGNRAVAAARVLPEPELPPPPPAAPPTPVPTGRAVTPVKPGKVRRPTWTLIAVAPTVSAGVRRFELRRWYLRVAAAGIAAFTIASFGGGYALGEHGDDERIEAAYSMLSEADLTVAALGDTLRALRIAAALSPAAGAAAATGTPSPSSAPRAIARVVLPVDGRITSRFARARRHPILGIWRSHDGLDIAAPSGTPIRTAAGGRVMRVERQLGYGLIVEINHGSGVHTRYAHCNSSRVTVGQRVTAGTIVATVGSTGISTGPHLHYEVTVNGRRVDPQRYIVPNTR